MLYKNIADEAERIVKKYNERDPFRLCRDMDIIMLFQSMGASEGAIKGFYFEACRIGTITVNSDLPDLVQRVIAAHELGHALLHKSENKRLFHETGLFDSCSQAEKEANLFAAELLVSDNEALEALNEGDFFSAAAALNIPPQLLEFKLRMMRYKGYKLANSPIYAENGFLKNINTDKVLKAL